MSVVKVAATRTHLASSCHDGEDDNHADNRPKVLELRRRQYEAQAPDCQLGCEIDCRNTYNPKQVVNGHVPSVSPNGMVRRVSRHDFLVRWFGGGDRKQRNRLGLRLFLTPKKFVTWSMENSNSETSRHAWSN